MSEAFAIPQKEKDVISRLDHLEAMVMKMSGKMEKIYDVVVGNDTFDQEGLINRIKKLEKENQKLTALKNKLIGAFIAGGAVWTIIWEFLKEWVKNR
jgi:hypothetical protein